MTGCALVVGTLLDRPARADDVLRAVLKSPLADRLMVRQLLARIPAELGALPARWLNTRISAESSAMRSVEFQGVS